MVAWQLFVSETPESAGGVKGDHLVGKYYVEFDKYYRAEQADLIAQELRKRLLNKRQFS